MRLEDQLHLADVLRTNRERLERVRDTLEGYRYDEVLRVCVKMLDVENFLRSDADERATGEGYGSARVRGRLERLTSSRLDTFAYQTAQPITLPGSYLRVRPPSPAPTISIVVPSYQQGHFIERTLHSITSQNYPSLELVVQDGGSTDETTEILERYDNKLKHWESGRDEGQADAIDKGFEHTSGEIMAYLNSDDMLLPGALAYVARYFHTHPDVDAVYGNRITINEHDQQVGIWVLPPHEPEVLRRVDFVPQETLFWRRSAWDKAGGHIDKNFGFALDWDLLLRLHNSGANIKHTNRFLGAFRVHAAQKTVTERDLCYAEIDRLLLREHGWPMRIEQARAEVDPYVRKHVVAHTLQLARDRLPGARFTPNFKPPAPVRSTTNH